MLAKNVNKSHYYSLTSFTAGFVAVLLVASATFVYTLETFVEGVPLYIWLLREDGPVEWLILNAAPSAGLMRVAV